MNASFDDKECNYDSNVIFNKFDNNKKTIDEFNLKNINESSKIINNFNSTEFKNSSSLNLEHLLSDHFVNFKINFRIWA